MPSTTHDGPTVPLSAISDGSLRVVFKIYFLVVVVAVAFLGSYCLRFRVRRQLLQGKPVSLAATTGWIHGPALAKIAFELRRVPGGWFGILMVLLTALEFISDIGVAKSITLVTQLSRTTSPVGLIVGNVSNFIRYPDVVFQAFTWATTSQDYSYNNYNQTGLTSNNPYGIYRFINAYDYNFLATPEDIIGYWTCSHDPRTPITYDVSFKGNKTELYDTDVMLDLIQRGLLYDDQGYLRGTNVTGRINGTFEGPSFQAVQWTASNYTMGSAPNFTFAVETSALDKYGSKEMDVFKCVLTCNDEERTAENVLRHVDIAQMMTNFILRLSGALFPGFLVDYSYDLPSVELTLEYYLNAMIMVAGSGQQTTMDNSAGYTYGVIEYATVIPYWIIAIAVITFALALFMLGYLVYLWLSNKRLMRIYDKDGTHRVSAKEINENTPVGLLEWMGHAAAMSRDTAAPEGKGLKNWILSTTWHGDQRLGVVKREEYGLLQTESKSGNECVVDGKV